MLLIRNKWVVTYIKTFFLPKLNKFLLLSRHRNLNLIWPPTMHKTLCCCCVEAKIYQSPPCRNLQYESCMQAVSSAKTGSRKNYHFSQTKELVGYQHMKIDRIFQINVMDKVSLKWWKIAPSLP